MEITLTLKTVALSALLLSGLSAGAMAAPIAVGSTINFSGTSNCTSTSCTFSGTTISGTSTGSFTPFTAANTAVTMFAFTFSPFTAQPIYTATEGPLTTGFTVTSQTSMNQLMVSGLTLTTVVDAGFATLTGFDSTPGNYVFTANQNGITSGSFSATTAVSAVPEPASMLILGAGLVGVGFVRRRRS